MLVCVCVRDYVALYWRTYALSTSWRVILHLLKQLSTARVALHSLAEDIA